MTELASLHAELRAALLAGDDTSAIRQAIAAAEMEQRAAAERKAQVAAERSAAEAQRIRSTADFIAAAATARLSAVTEPLRPPPAPMPWGVG